MLIYLRHGDDGGSGSDSVHRHDKRLNEQSRKKATKLAKRLTRKYGQPSAVYVSPFQRTLETLDAMSERFEGAVTVHQDPRISRYFSKKQQRDPDISPKTRASAVPIVEDRDDFHRRVRKHIEAMRQAKHHRSRAVIWCITHTIVMKDVSGYFDAELPEHLDFLEYIVVRK